jgi:hypothetical protein
MKVLGTSVQGKHRWLSISRIDIAILVVKHIHPGLTF